MCFHSFTSWFCGYSEIKTLQWIPTLAQLIRTPEFRNDDDMKGDVTILTGIQFKKLYPHRHFITPHTPDLRQGLNKVQNFTPNIEEADHGFYFTDQANVSWLKDATHVWTTHIPDNAQLIIDYNMIKASQIELSNKHTIDDELDTIITTIINDERQNQEIRPFLDLFTLLSAWFPNNISINLVTTQIKNRISPNATIEQKLQLFLEHFRQYMLKTDPTKYCIFGIINAIEKHDYAHIFTYSTGDDTCMDWIMFTDLFMHMFKMKELLLVTLITHLFNEFPHIFNDLNARVCLCNRCKNDQLIHDKVLSRISAPVPIPQYEPVMINPQSYVDFLEKMKQITT